MKLSNLNRVELNGLIDGSQLKPCQDTQAQ